MNENIKIRLANDKDAPALLEIYRPYVEQTTITFEYDVPSIETFTERIQKTLLRYPYLVAELENEIVGYAYASPFKTRAAYDWSVETSIYVKQSIRGKGIGKKLYAALETYLKAQHIVNVNACITYPNNASIGFHEQLGYQKVAHFTKCGYKLGQWCDMIWMEKMLGEHNEAPLPVRSIQELLEEAHE